MTLILSNDESQERENNQNLNLIINTSFLYNENRFNA